jgi:hypothetical protein
VTPDGANDAIVIELLANWPAAAAAALGAVYPVAGVPVFLEDENQAEPNPGTPYVYVSIEHGIAIRWTMGRNAKFGTDGTIYIKLAWPMAGGNGFPDGSAWLLKLAAAIKNAISVRQLAAGAGEDGVTVQAASISAAAQDGAYWILAVTLPFQYTEIR